MVVDPITVEIIKSALIYASEEMGIAVRNSAYSPNIKERLDHSCALFDSQGRLIAQAEHIPVHLGSLPWGLRQTIAFISERHGGVREEDMWVVNDPYISGTHLNDVTVIRPVFFEKRLAGYAANKAHHTDVGGMVPGSMSADAIDLFAEGFVVTPVRLDEAAVSLFCANSRSPQARSGDLRAQTAGNYTGERRMIELFDRYGRNTVEAAIEQILDNSEGRMRAALRSLGNGVFEANDVLEDRDGTSSIPIALRVTLDGGNAHFDYTGTAEQVGYPMNAVYGVTLSGIYYALRAVTDPSIPMNEGCFRPVRVDVPEGCILNPRRPAPVGGGNVETSTRNAGIVLAALAHAAPNRVPAESGGTMSNVMIGNDTWTFYETNGCGMGARPAMDGIDGIQCHMTNTLNTPIEAIERDFPLRVTQYEFIEGSGGEGRYRGGNGLIRALQITGGTAQVSLLAERHRVAPRGANGGGSAARGSHELRRANGEREHLGAKARAELRGGDTLVVRTPGGGGYGVAVGRGNGEASGAGVTGAGTGVAGTGDDGPGT